MFNSWRRCLGAVLAVAILTSVMVPGLALAQSPDPLTDPSAAVYGSDIPGDGSAAGEAAGSANSLDDPIGRLPFTGLDLIVLAGMALVLTGTGLALRRLSAPRGT